MRAQIPSSVTNKRAMIRSRKRTLASQNQSFTFNKVEEKNDKACCAGKRACDAVSKENEGSPKSRAKVEQDKPAETEPAGNGKADVPAKKDAHSGATEPATASAEAQ